MSEPPVRVCYVISHFHPFASGAERQALAQGVELVRRGHSAHVVTQAIPGLPGDEDVRGVHIHRWVEPISLGPLFAVTFVAGVILALRSLRPEYDLIHTHQGLWEAISTGLGRGVFGNPPVLVQPASSGYYGEAEELARTGGFPLLRRAILRNRAFAAISADIERQWLSLGVPPGRMVRMASGVDTGHFCPGSVSDVSGLPPRPRVIFTGRIHPQKNLGVLLEAWPAVSRRTGASLILVGQGPERDRLAASARTLGVADRIHFLGEVDDPAGLLRAADAFVLPSVAEGMSNSLLEAMATSLPCLASAIGGNTDLLRDGHDGLLIPPGDPSAWSCALLRVLENPSFARSLGVAARRRIEAEFSLAVVIDRYLALYRRMLAGTWPDEDRHPRTADRAASGPGL